jgi:UDP-glucose 4-epimerase
MNEDVIKKVVVTGAAGFIGSNLVDSLLNQGLEVVGVDNFSTGKKEFLKAALNNSKFTLIEEDIYSGENLLNIFLEKDTVFHFAANADVRYGPSHPARDLEQNTIATHRVLEAVRIAGVKRFIFSSTGSVYGEAQVVPTPEDAPFPVQTSLYGASKLACEGMIAAYAESFGIQAWIFRFVSILGPRYTHGHVYDFYKQLMKHSNKLIVLGNGHQKKSYLHVNDCISAILLAIHSQSSEINVYNLGVDGICEVRDSITWITDELGCKPEIIFSGGSRGWIGDNPLIYLDTKKIRSLGWKPDFTIEQGVRSTVRYLKANQHLLSN